MDDKITPSEYIMKLEKANTEAAEYNSALTNASNSMFESDVTHNLIEYQLDLSEDLEKIFHLLRGDVLTEDKKGNMYFVAPTDDNMKIFNDYGVHILMQTMTGYLSKNTLLSNYTEDVINEKLHSLGIALKKLIYTKYEKMGMNTADKRKMMPLIVIEVTDIIHSAYLRALRGGERESLRKVMHVAQTNNAMNDYGRNQSMMQQRKFSLFSPTTWGN